MNDPDIVEFGSADEPIDLDALDDEGPRSAQVLPRVLRRHPMLSLLGALAVGLLVGALGWRALDHSRNRAEDLAAASLVGTVSNVDVGERSAQYDVQLTNIGATDVTVRSVHALGAKASDGDAVSTRLPSLGSTSVRVQLPVECTGDDVPPSLVAVVRTPDGRTRDVDVVLVGQGAGLEADLCPQPMSLALYGSDTSARVVSPGVAEVVVGIGNATLSAGQVVGVKAQSPLGFTVSATVMPVTIGSATAPGALTQSMTTTWRVRDCAGAATLRPADLGVVLSYAAGGGTSTIRFTGAGLDVLHQLVASCSGTAAS